MSSIKYKRIFNDSSSSGTSSGSVNSVVQGTGITVDNTDPANPIISSAIQSSISASAIDWNYTHLYKTLSANTTFTFSNVADAKTIIIAVTNTASNYTVTWPSGVLWTGGTEPTQTIGAKTDIYTLTQINGVIYGSYVQDLS